MSQISIAGASTGTATFTLESPATSTNRTITLADATGTMVVSGTTPSLNGITFPATQVASADANTLDDYEEGTWTPSLGGNTTYGGQVGYYVKVGSLVLVQGQVAVTTIGTGSTTTISGMPFTVTNVNGNRTAGSISYFDALNINVIALYVVAQPNNTQITFASSNSSGAVLTNDPAAIFKNATNVQFTMTYRAA
jgi:hypothetical protein